MALMGSSGNHRQFLIANRQGIILFVSTFGFFLYLLLGGYIFLWIEGPEETAEKNAVWQAKDEALEKYPNVPGEAIDYFIRELSIRGVRGIVVENATTKWTIGNSVLYATTLLTTIGYGHLSTTSVLGKIVCMFYSLFGIPLTLFVLASYVDILQMVSNFFLASLFERLRSRLGNTQIRLIHISIVMIFIVVGCFLFPAYIFSTVEITWSYFDAVYFCFISLTTVGLGDYVPGRNMKHPLIDLYRFGATVYLIIGVTVTMFVLAEMTSFIKNYNKPYQGSSITPSKATSKKLTICNEVRPPSYGTIIVQMTKTFDDDETKTLLP